MEYPAPAPPDTTCVVCHDEKGTTWLCGEGWVGDTCLEDAVKAGPVEPPPEVARARES